MTAQNTAPFVTSPFSAFAADGVAFGDILRGERITQGKTLKDAQRALRIDLRYLKAIEAQDTETFSRIPGYVSSYVRSYARFLNLDPDATLHAFESSLPADTLAPRRLDTPQTRAQNTPERIWLPQDFSGLFTVASFLLLFVVLSFGAHIVLRNIQKVELAPIDSPPVVLDRLDGVPEGSAFSYRSNLQGPHLIETYTPRDSAISTLDPDAVGHFGRVAALPVAPTTLQDTAAPAAAVSHFAMLALQETWVRVRDGDGLIVYERLMQAGQSFELPNGEGVLTLRTGNAGGLAFAIDGHFHGPLGHNGEVHSNITLDKAALSQSLPSMAFESQNVLARYALEHNFTSD